MDNFENYMTPPYEPGNKAYLQDGWLHCPYCGKKIFPVGKETTIYNLEWICKNSKCKKPVMIEQTPFRVLFDVRRLSDEQIMEALIRVKKGLHIEGVE